jgi:hypothetical protein
MSNKMNINNENNNNNIINNATTICPRLPTPLADSNIETADLCMGYVKYYYNTFSYLYN